MTTAQLELCEAELEIPTGEAGGDDFNTRKGRDR
jgi:hypothetical protein